MANHGIGAHERVLLQEFTGYGTERFSQSAALTLASAKDVREANRTIAHVGKYTRIGGFLGKGDVSWGQHVARLTAEQKAAIEYIDPEILTDRRKFYWWLENLADPRTDVRGKFIVY